MKIGNIFRKIFKSFIICSILLLTVFFFACNININSNNNNDTNITYVDNVYEEITDLFDENAVIEDILVPDSYKGVDISMVSSTPEVISNDGVVNRQEQDELVELTFTFNYKGTEYEKKIQVIVLAKEEVETTYTASLSSITNGTVVLSKSSNISSGETITITVTPNTGYQLEWLKVNGASIAVNNNSAVYVVTTNVTVTASFITIDNGDQTDTRIDSIEDDLAPVLSLAGTKVIENIVFPSTSLYDSTIIWSISDTDVISMEGVVDTSLQTRTTITIGYQIILDGVEYDFVYFIVYVGGTTTYIAYYSGINTQTGTTLLKALRTIITETHTNKTSYGDCKTPSIVAKTDGDPNRSGYIILFWSGLSVPSTWDGGTTWNREHVWPQSQGWFSTSGAGADLHHIRPTDASVNTSHGNRPYSVISGGSFVKTSSTNGSITTECKTGGNYFEPCDERKGDTARIIFYLLTRYSEADSYAITKVASSMSMLLEWNATDPVDDSETRRNEAVYDIQGNRNPFIDYPEFADMIWGSGTRTVSDTHNNTVSIKLNKLAEQYNNEIYF